jgi:[citrate (pro-3S)-lyase] ligase
MRRFTINTEVKTLDLTDPQTFKDWQSFLMNLGLDNFEPTELKMIDKTLGVFNETGELVATGSIAGNILKYIGTCQQATTQGRYFNVIVSALMNELAYKHIFHIFVFTKLKYVKSFQRIGFCELAHTAMGAILETGDTSVTDFIQELPHVSQTNGKIGAIVMNANPFTLGHRYLVETAAKQNDWVYVFVVMTDNALFTAAERLQLVKSGLHDLKNVMVVAGGDYMVSYLTFPAYFLPASSDTVHFQTQLDALIFKNKIAPPLNITTRYLGSEPYSRTTQIYNEMLQQTLPPQVTVRIVTRKSNRQGIITATQVRRAMAAGQVTPIKQFVPATTYQYIVDNWQQFQLRIKKGTRIDGN